MYKHEFTSSGLKLNSRRRSATTCKLYSSKLRKSEPADLVVRADEGHRRGKSAKHLQGLAVFAKELYLTIHLLKNAALGGDSASESSGGRTPLKSKPQTQVRGET